MILAPHMFFADFKQSIWVDFIDQNAYKDVSVNIMLMSIPENKTELRVVESINTLSSKFKEIEFEVI